MKHSIAAVAACMTGMCIASLPLAAPGDDARFPQRAVRIIVPTAPSGGADLLGRVAAQRLGERWGQNVVIDNRAGAASLIGVELCARAAPDGYTLVVVNPSYMLTAQTSGRLSFERGGDFTPIAFSANTAMLFVMYPGVPAKSLKELVELARAKPRSFDYGSGGTGTATHLLTELFASMAGIELTHVPYKGGGASVPPLMSGQVQLTLSAAATVLPQVQAGRLRALAVTGKKRLPALPEIPTFAEAGYPRYGITVWYGVFGPAKIPAPLAARLNADLNWVWTAPEVAERLAGAGFDSAGGLSTTQFSNFVAAELVTWKEALAAAGMR